MYNIKVVSTNPEVYRTIFNFYIVGCAGLGQKLAENNIHVHAMLKYSINYFLDHKIIKQSRISTDEECINISKNI